MTTVGDRIRLVSCSDPYTKLVPGAEGTVTFIDSLGTVHVAWDDGHTMGLVRGEDQWTVIPHAIVRSESGRPVAEADDWVCICGNSTYLNGFYACDSDGNEIEPNALWDGISWICGGCTRIINGQDGSLIREPGPFRWLT